MNNIIPFQELVNQSVKDDRRGKKEITSWHVSKLGSCLRGIYFERLGEQPDTELTDRELRIFNVGHIFEEWVVDLAKKQAGLSVETQVRVEDKALNVSGYADAVIGWNGSKKVYEFKTKHSKSFWYMSKEGKPMRQHEYQLWTYLHLLGIEEGSLVYVSKDDLSILEYPVYRKDKELKKEVMAEIDMLNKAWQDKNPSLLPLPSEKDWRATYCRYHKGYCLKV